MTRTLANSDRYERLQGGQYLKVPRLLKLASDPSANIRCRELVAPKQPVAYGHQGLEGFQQQCIQR